jgi:hypothetical protein
MITLALFVRKGIITESEMYEYYEELKAINGTTLNDMPRVIEDLIKRVN